MAEERRKLALPDRRQNTYEELEKKLERELTEHTTSVEDRLGRFFKKALFIFSVIGITSAVALFGFTITLGQIKKTRREFVEVSCKDQNRRHDKTIVELRKAQAEAIKRTPQMANQIRTSAQSSIAIIDALVPKRNCKLLGEIAVGDATPPPIPSTPKANRHIKENP